MNQRMPIAAIIVASGESRRMGFDKLTADLNGKPVLYHAVAAFCHCASIDEIYVVCPDERFECLTELQPLKKIHQVQGGRDRQPHTGPLTLPHRVHLWRCPSTPAPSTPSPSSSSRPHRLIRLQAALLASAPSGLVLADAPPPPHQHGPVHARAGSAATRQRGLLYNGARPTCSG